MKVNDIFVGFERGRS